MWLTDEIHFDPIEFRRNINLDPTRRYGNETMATWQATENVRVQGRHAYTRAVFREGPLPATTCRWCRAIPRMSACRGTSGSGSCARCGGALCRCAQRMDNDQTNVQPLIPALTAVDFALAARSKKLLLVVRRTELVRHSLLRLRASPVPFSASVPSMPIRCRDAPLWCAAGAKF